MAALSPEQVQQLYADIREVDRKYQHPRADFEVFMKHLLHILQVVGPEHAGIGADWDGGGGVTGPRTSVNCQGLPSGLWTRATQNRISPTYGAAICFASSTRRKGPRIQQQ